MQLSGDARARAEAGTAAERRPDKRASQVARRIEADIIRRGWPVGQSLGSEQALQQRYQVSRSVLGKRFDSSSITGSRACVAVRMAVCWSASRMRRRPPSAIIIYLEYLGITIDDLLKARLLLEPLAASRAALRIDEAGIDRLRAVLRAEQDRRPDQAAPNDEFHAALADQSKNPVLQLFIDILMRLTVRYAEDSRLDSASDALEAIEHRHRDHSAIVAAVTAGDAGARDDAERTTCGIGDKVAARPPSPRWSLASEQRRS